MAIADRFILLRHARAGKQIANRSRDFKCGLDSRGEEEALRLPEVIMTVLRPSMILSSPFRRCVETVEPLAETMGLNVVNDKRFTPECRAHVRDAFADVAADSVVCTHGEIITRLLEGQRKCAKGAFWVVERRGDTFAPVRYVEVPTATRT